MKNQTLISVRSNCDFSLNYEKGTLHPKVEVILITTAPKYKLNSKKGTLVKEQDVQEFRFQAGLDSVNQLIGELQLVVTNMNAFEQLSGSFNALITNQQKEEKKG